MFIDVFKLLQMQNNDFYATMHLFFILIF